MDFGKGYTQTRLRYYIGFYEVFSKCPTTSDELTYSHYCEKIWLDEAQINYYIKTSKEYKLSVREFRYRVKNNGCERYSSLFFILQKWCNDVYW